MRSFLCLSAILVLGATISAQKFDGNGRRSFEDVKPIYVDLDGDGKQDTITPRTYSAKTRHGQHHWITFDAQLSGGRVIKKLFTYKYGDNIADYWVYALRPLGDINHDRMGDLLFYSGDDTSDETVVLISEGNRYVVKSRHTSNSDKWARSRN